METIIVPIKLNLKWQFKDNPNFKVSTCKKIVNCQTKKILKKTMSGRSVGFNIGDKFYKLSSINDFLELIPEKRFCPFSNNTIEI